MNIYTQNEQLTEQINLADSLAFVFGKGYTN